MPRRVQFTPQRRRAQLLLPQGCGAAIRIPAGRIPMSAEGREGKLRERGLRQEKATGCSAYLLNTVYNLAGREPTVPYGNQNGTESAT